MSEFIQFFQSADVTLSDKLLEIAYIVMGLIAVYAGARNAQDKTNPKRVGTAFFWVMCGMLFIVGRWVPSAVSGAMVVLMVVPAILKQVGRGSADEPTAEEMQGNFDRIGMKLFVPALSLGVMALVFALFTNISSLVGLTFGVVVGGLLLFAFSHKNTPRVFLNDTRRMLDAVGPLSMLPILLAALGSIFTAAGVGDVISHIVSGVIPQGNLVVGIVVYAVGMAVFTMVMGNAYGAITVLTVGIGAPFVLSLGADPALVGSVALTCGFCGTLMTPMAANFNILPVAILEMRDSYGVIKKQVPIALFMLAAQIVYLIVAVAL